MEAVAKKNAISLPEVQKDRNEKFDLASCPMVSTLELIGGKWKLGIICYLRQGTWRFNQLQRHIPKIKHKVLIQQLRELEEAELVHRKIYAEIPPRVEYSLTEKGKSLLPVLSSLHAWGREYFADCCAKPMKKAAKKAATPIPELGQ